jgi:hypothetical protein
MNVLWLIMTFPASHHRMSIYRLFLFLLILWFGLESYAEATTEADVIVYGATPGGFCAAIAASREGATVILLEPTDHVGGVNTGGLCFSDSNQTVRGTLQGLFEEWHIRIEADYRERGVSLPYEVKIKDHSEWTYEPHVAMRVTQAMLSEAGVKVITRARIRSVSKQGTRIGKLVTSGGDFEARVFIDGTYEGDLMAASGVNWTIGREGRDEFGESYAGKQYPKPKIDVSGLDNEGQLLPLITAKDAGHDEAGDKNVMVYSFRLCVTKDPSNRVPFPEPDHYDPARFEVVRRYMSQEKRPGILWDLYKLPGNKFDANNGIAKQFSMGLVGAGNEWCEADETGRARIWEAHKQYTLEMYRFLTTDPAVPERLRLEMKEYGLCRDEFRETGHWSPQLYVREGRRMIGEYVLSQKDIIEDPKKADPIAVSSFPIDSHDCQRIGTVTAVVNEGTIRPVRMAGRKHGYPYHIPYRAITPKSFECDNLLVPVALSCTHVGISSIRVEPTWMVIGQSAGIAAAICAKQNTAVQHLPYTALRERLLSQKQVLDLPVLADPSVPSGLKPASNGTLKNATVNMDSKTLPGIILDDTHAELKGEWKDSALFKPYVDTGYRHDDQRADGESVAIFRFTAPKSGQYKLAMAYSAHETRATNVPVIVMSGGRTVELKVDQTEPLPVGDCFRVIGTIELEGNSESMITVSNAGTDGFVILDALQLVLVQE